nr:polyphenol oxidase family protein [Cellulomonas marina]
MRRVDLGPGVVAAFTTRHGGVSRPPWDALDLGLHVGDDPAAVRENRRRLEGVLGLPVSWARQVHGTAVLVVPPAGAATGAGADGDGQDHEQGPGQDHGQGDGPDDLGEADALLVAHPGTAGAVLVADCVPVLLADAAAGVAAAVHVGRRGLVAGVLAAALGAMTARGARADRVRAALGPAVAGRSYEVPATLREEVADLVPAAAATTAWGTPALDLPAGVRGVLAGLGVTSVVDVGVDTFADADQFSYRRAGGGATGRSAGVVGLV